MDIDSDEVVDLNVLENKGGGDDVNKNVVENSGVIDLTSSVQTMEIDVVDLTGIVDNKVEFVDLTGVEGPEPMQVETVDESVVVVFDGSKAFRNCKKCKENVLKKMKSPDFSKFRVFGKNEVVFEEKFDFIIRIGEDYLDSYEGIPENDPEIQKNANKSNDFEMIEVDPVEATESQAEVKMTYDQFRKSKNMGNNARAKRLYKEYSQTAEEKEQILQKKRDYAKARKAAETPEQRAQNLSLKRALTNLDRDEDSHYVAKAKRARKTSAKAEIRKNETDSQRQTRLESVRVHVAETRQNESETQRQERLESNRLNTSEARQNETDPKSKEFHENMMKYGASFSFAFMTGQKKDLPGIFNLKYQGVISRVLPRYLHPKQNGYHAFGQLYILETSDAIKKRTESIITSVCNKDTLAFLHKVFESKNLYAQSYKMFHEFEKLEIEKAALLNKPPPVCQMIFKKTTDNTSSPHTYPTSNEIAGVYCPNENESIPFDDLIVECKRPDSNRRIIREEVDKNSVHMEPMTFPIFYPTGKGDFWFDKKKLNEISTKNMSARSYFTSKIAVRPETNGYFNPIIHGGKLLSKYAIWGLAKIENDHLDWVKKNQKQLKVSSYAGLSDYVSRISKENDVIPGKTIILPSSFTQGPRYMSEKFHDAMSCVQKYGKPHLFITFTCNPDCPDIVNNLLPGQKAFDRPDLVCKVFNLQVQQFIQEMTKGGIFGKVVYYLAVIEFQKRGLPHVHSLWTMEEDDWNEPDKIDAFISAELPDETKDKELFDLVSKKLMHNPCGRDNPQAMCMQNNKCKRFFPKDFSDTTTLNKNGYPEYRRRDTGITAKVKVKGREMTIDNRSVVPHNPYLVKRFQSHINVEIVSCLAVVTYLFKYLFKGPDKTNVEIVGTNANYDEVKSYQEMRYLSSTEAIYRLFSYPMHKSNVSVERLAIHEEEQQTIALTVDQNEHDLMEAMMKDSKLLAFFKLNQNLHDNDGYKKDKNGNPIKIRYIDVCDHYTWHANSRTWQDRKSMPKDKLTRIYAINPKNVEKFYLRKLLHVVKGPRGYDDLKRDPHDANLVHLTFREACVARGLVLSDQMYIDAMVEGALHQTGRGLRSFFVNLIVHCDVGEPLELWEMFKVPLSMDIKKQKKGSISDEQAEILAFTYAMRNISRSDKTVADFPKLNDRVLALGIDLNDFTVDTVVHNQIAQDFELMFNPEQQKATESIVESINTGKNNCIYVNGPGGTGKSTIFKYVYSKTLSMNKKIIMMAWSGIAASLYENGRTCHNVFKLDFPFREDSNSGIDPTSALGKDLLNVDVIVWDEAPMAPRQSLEVVNRKLQEIMQNDKLFGGKIMVLGGDFAQIPPVVENGTRFDVVRNSIKSSDLWNEFEKNTFILTQNMRAANANAHDGFAEDILKIATGESNDSDSKVKIPVSCINENDNSLVKDIFGDIVEGKKFDQFTSRSIICTLNEQVDEYNKEIVEMLDSTGEMTYEAVDTVEMIEGDELDGTNYSAEYFETFRKSGFPAYELKLRINSVIMLLRNLSISEGLCNGTRLVVKKLERNVIVCERLTTMKNQDKTVLIPKINLTDDSTAYKLTRNQFPVRVAFALTINKSQGQTFEKIGVDVSKGVFSHGHLYVALSRTRAWDRLTVKLHPDDVLKTTNIVYPELLIGSEEVHPVPDPK